MGRVYTVLSWLLTVGVVMAQTVQSDNQRLLPQWLTGIIAVAAFLFLAFIAVVVNKAWCEHSSREAAQEKDEHHVMTKGNTYDTTVDVVRSNEYENAYDNLAVDTSEERVTGL